MTISEFLQASHWPGSEFFLKAAEFPSFHIAREETGPRTADARTERRTSSFSIGTQLKG